MLSKLIDLLNKDVQIVECPDRAAWLRERVASIGASESAAILEESSYASPLSVWQSKVQPEFTESTKRQRTGQIMETAVCEMYRDEYGGEVIQWPSHSLIRPTDRPYIHATPDAFLLDDEHDGLGLAQIKTWSPFQRSAWDNGPPLPYQIQVQHEMHVTGCQWAMIPVFFDVGGVERFEVPRNDRFIESLLKALEEFWVYVVDRIEPPVDGTAATAAALAALHPDDDGTAVALPEDGDDLLDSLERAKRIEKLAQQRRRSCENKLKAWIGDHTYGVTPDGRAVSWKTQSRKEHIVKASTFRVLRTNCRLPKSIELLESAAPQLTAE